MRFNSRERRHHVRYLNFDASDAASGAMPTSAMPHSATGGVCNRACNLALSTTTTAEDAEHAMLTMLFVCFSLERTSLFVCLFVLFVCCDDDDDDDDIAICLFTNVAPRSVPRRVDTSPACVGGCVFCV